MIENIPSTLTGHRAIKLVINNNKIFRNSLNIWELSNRLLNNQWDELKNHK